MILKRILNGFLNRRDSLKLTTDEQYGFETIKKSFDDIEIKIADKTNDDLISEMEARIVKEYYRIKTENPSLSHDECLDKFLEDIKNNNTAVLVKHVKDTKRWLNHK